MKMILFFIIVLITAPSRAQQKPDFDSTLCFINYELSISDTTARLWATAEGLIATRDFRVNHFDLPPTDTSWKAKRARTERNIELDANNIALQKVGAEYHVALLMPAERRIGTFTHGIRLCLSTKRFCI